ncbi:hypothetical protein AURDEDRAFT_163574 [Auricularia subglabra TFB-10046 SS5]|nr:hypothetical protein AURDEDRAFT_163574 [Auricularia subglabra TFB-10046 SS5]
MPPEQRDVKANDLDVEDNEKKVSASNVLDESAQQQRLTDSTKRQAITLCERPQLYDALFYVYTRSLRDDMSPLVELLRLVRRVQKNRKERNLSSLDDCAVEQLTLNADVWLHVLRNDMNDQDHPVPTFMRTLVQYTFSDLLSHSRSKVSLSRLFKRLVARSASKTIT